MLLQFCQISKAFGEPVEKVLYVFDGQYTDGEVVDVQSLTAKVRMPQQNKTISSLPGFGLPTPQLACLFLAADPLFGFPLCRSPARSKTCCLA